MMISIAHTKQVSRRDPDAHIEGAAGRVTHSTAGTLRAIEHLTNDGVDLVEPAPLTQAGFKAGDKVSL